MVRSPPAAECVVCLKYHDPVGSRKAPPCAGVILTLQITREQAMNGALRPLSARQADEGLTDFRQALCQLQSAGPSDVSSLIERLIEHPFYLRLQRKALRSLPARVRAEALEEAKGQFAQRLWSDPTLGVNAHSQEQLPGFVRNHARSIASSLVRRSKAQSRLVPLDTTVVACRRTAESSVTDFIDELDHVLDELEFLVGLFRFRLAWPRAAVAAALDLTVHRIRTVEADIRKRLLRHFAAA